MHEFKFYQKAVESQLTNSHVRTQKEKIECKVLEWVNIHWNLSSWPVNFVKISTNVKLAENIHLDSVVN